MAAKLFSPLGTDELAAAGKSSPRRLGDVNQSSSLQRRLSGKPPLKQENQWKLLEVVDMDSERHQHEKILAKKLLGWGPRRTRFTASSLVYCGFNNVSLHPNMCLPFMLQFLTHEKRRKPINVKTQVL